MPEAPIVISPAAETYIKGNGGVVTVRLAPRHGCCGGIASLAIAETRAPDVPENYARFDLNDIQVYMDDELVGEGLRIDCEGWWKLRRLYVDGAAIHSPRR
ncbi:CC/Se motif family (seleno)protein [Vreelandella aquamarina]